MDLRDKLVLRPDKRITLADWDPGDTLGLDKEAAAEKTEQNIARLDELQYLMYAEQRRRFEERLRDPTKQWKLSPSDFEDRKHWDDYVAAYEDALTRCSTSDAPWLIVPADKKWFRNFAVSRILVETLEALDMRFP